MATFRRDNQKGIEVTHLENSMIQSPDLSWAAKGVLSYIYSLSEDCPVTVQDLIEKGGRNEDGTPAYGQEKIQEVIMELKQNGFINIQS